MYCNMINTVYGIHTVLEYSNPHVRQSGALSVDPKTVFDSSKFFVGLATFGPLLRYDLLLLLTLLPVVIGLTFLAKNHIHIDSILFLILGTLIAGPVLIMFTNFYEILPYRYIPLIVFFAIGVSLFFTKKPISSE